MCVCVCTCSFLCSSLNTVDWLTAMVTSWEDATLSEFCKHEGKGEGCQRGRGVRGGGVSEGEGCQRGRGVRGGGGVETKTMGVCGWQTPYSDTCIS